jgi:hypothetical protein
MDTKVAIKENPVGQNLSQPPSMQLRVLSDSEVSEVSGGGRRRWKYGTGKGGIMSVKNVLAAGRVFGTATTLIGAYQAGWWIGTHIYGGYVSARYGK